MEGETILKTLHSVLKFRFKKPKVTNSWRAESLNKSLLYVLIAAVLGVLLVATPLFIIFEDEAKDYYAAFLLSRSKSIEELENPYGLRAMGYSDPKPLVVLVIGFATAILTYLLAKARFSH